MIDILELDNVVKTWPGFRLGPLTLSIPQGAIIGYIGENGAGKSTTIKLILDLLRPDAGTIRLFGKTMNEDPKGIRDRIGVVFDELHLPEDLRIRETERFCARVYSRWSSGAFQSYANRFSLPLDKKIKELSRGMKMKLSLAIALSHEADLLLLDEATSGLDPVIRDELLDILMEFIQDETKSVFISSHILSDLEKAADYIAFLHDGKLVFMEEKDILRDDFALCQCDASTAESLSSDAVVGRRSGRFGEQLLVRRSLVPADLTLERPSIEDIMLFFVKGNGHARADS